jgi:hypothetical protein
MNCSPRCGEKNAKNDCWNYCPDHFSPARRVRNWSRGVSVRVRSERRPQNRQLGHNAKNCSDPEHELARGLAHLCDPSWMVAVHAFVNGIAAKATRASWAFAVPFADGTAR